MKQIAFSSFAHMKTEGVGRGPLKCFAQGHTAKKRIEQNFAQMSLVLESLCSFYYIPLPISIASLHLPKADMGAQMVGKLLCCKVKSWHSIEAPIESFVQKRVAPKMRRLSELGLKHTAPPVLCPLLLPKLSFNALNLKLTAHNTSHAASRPKHVANALTALHITCFSTE